MKKIILSSAIATLALVSCGESAEQRAGNLLHQADAAYSAGNYQSAKVLIDSIRVTYPDVIDVRRKALELKRSVELAEQQRTLDHCRASLARLEARRDSLLPSFEYEADKRYQDEGFYIVPSQSLRLNVYNSLLRARVTESGRAYITSLYRGKRIAHRSVKVSSGDSYASCSEPFVSHTFRNLGVNNERLDFIAGEDGGLMNFIATARGPLTVELEGEQGKHSYALRESDAKAIASVLELSMVLTAITEYKEIAAEAERHITFVEKARERFSAAATESAK